LDGALVSNDFPCFDIDDSTVLPHYFEWYSRTPEFVDLCRRASAGSTNRVRMKEEKFLQMVVPLPSLDEQHRIVQRLDTVAALVEERRRAIDAAERETQALLLKAFQRAIDGAPLRPMSEVAPLVRRPVEIDLDGTYPELGVRSFGKGTFHKPELPGAEVGNKKLFRINAGDLLFNIVFAWEGAVAVASRKTTAVWDRTASCHVCPPPIRRPLSSCDFTFQHAKAWKSSVKPHPVERGETERSV